MSTRRGFTMITTLWVMTVAGVMAAAAALSGRLTVETTRNRVLLERSFWLASGCAARAQASIDEELARATSFESAADTWRVLGRLLASRLTSADSQCVVTL